MILGVTCQVVSEPGATGARRTEMDTLQPTCMSCRHRVTTTHRHGAEMNTCRRLGIIVSAANIIGETVECPHYTSRNITAAVRDRVGMPAYLL